MASLASLASLGSAGATISPSNFTSSYPLPFHFSNYRKIQRWPPLSLCKCMVTAVTDKPDSISLSKDPNFRNSGGGNGNKDNSGLEKTPAELVLKPSPKPVILTRPQNVSAIDVGNGSLLGRVQKKPDAVQSLDEVLQRAERLEKAAAAAKEVKKVGNGPTGRALNSAAKTNTKSVWRKGNPVSSVQKAAPGAVSRPPPAIPGDVVGKVDVFVGPQEKNENVVVAAASAQPNLQMKPSAPAIAASAPAAPPMVISNKPSPILKDVGAVFSPSAPPVDVASPSKPRERKPILIDKFAVKRPPGSDPPTVGHVLTRPIKPGRGPPPPLKPARGPLSSKMKEDWRKKSNAAGGISKRRMSMEGDVDEVAEIGVSIGGAPGVRKGRKWSKASRRAARLHAARAAAPSPVKVDILEVGEEGMLTQELAFKLAVREADILRDLFIKGIRLPLVHTLDKEMVKMICKEYDVEVIEADPLRVEDMAKKKEMLDVEDLENLEVRPPVLTIMGHVDHGKTTLLDYIRKSQVAASEAGGITQGIGAYKVLVPMDGKLQPCVFLDTPGHEAFGAMRARGASVTDIAIIVVAADDGVRPQTNEAIAHAKAAGVPIVVAINKIDKDGASAERVMQELSSIGLMAEDWGGATPMVQISALKGENVDELLETVMLIAELQELRANPHRKAKGTVIEARLDKSKGPVATFIVQNGTLKRGDVVVCGEAYGKVRAMFDDSGARVDEAGPSIAVQVIGLNCVPIAGDEFEAVDSLDTAREKAEISSESLRDQRINAKAGDERVTLSSLASAVSAGKQAGVDMHQLNIILKVDVQGSIEAIRQALQVLPQDNVTLKFLLQAAGDINSSDVDLAVASKAIIVGFNVRVPGSVKALADNKGIEVRLYKVIYDLIDDMRNGMEGLLDSIEEHVPIGSAVVRAVFSSGSGRVAGCMVMDGKVVKDTGVQVLRNGKIIHKGKIDSLKRVKELVKEVDAGLECGIGVEGFADWAVGDVIETFSTVEKRRTLEEASASVAAALVEAGVKF